MASRRSAVELAPQVRAIALALRVERADQRREHQLVQPQLGNLAHPVAVDFGDEIRRRLVAQVVLLYILAQQEEEQPRLAHAGRADHHARFARAQALEERFGQFPPIGKGVFRSNFGHDDYWVWDNELSRNERSSTQRRKDAKRIGKAICIGASSTLSVTATQPGESTRNLPCVFAPSR